MAWGHDYEGPVLIDNEHRFPWEDRFSDREYIGPDPVLTTNPYDVPDIQSLLAEDPKSPPSSTLSVSQFTTLAQDVFFALPEELRSVIATCLPTLDVLNLRLVSRAFWTMFNNQQFWASRFGDSSDRSWLFEARHSTETQNWRWLYRRTNSLRRGFGLQNRVRVWNLAQKLVDILDFHWVDIGVNYSPCSDQRVEASGEMWEQPVAGYSLFDKGCRLFERHLVTIPEQLSRISVCSIQLGDMSYVTGLKFTTVVGGIRQIGYWATPEQSLETSDVCGFKLAVGERGIQALQCIDSKSSTYPWIGCPERSPKTLRLNVGDHVADLEIGFDGCKIVSLSVYSQFPSPNKMLHDGNRLRNSGMWYPDVPEQNLCLNEASFPPRENYLSGYKPLFWTSFGGSGGSGIRRIDFTYDIAVPSEHQTFGCQASGEWTKVTDFAIDGAGGEFINAIEVFQHYPNEGYPWLVEEGTVVAFKTTTNRERSCFFSFHSDPPSSLPFVVTASPGTAITGFYGSHRPHDGSGITALGVISEAIEGK
ncbi:hypothetical protein GCG54_00000986 [Colletotrichum gloeosporioides]|uniref:F-box domain-containing protein n=1 Tax=Colletotrichum gloeosporioides TaxID=474922 RepID=A0A8H4C960_COLGL|nr:uncharacterized protein GCG54_00000986 [Colletotrichum gloeosporioides]KAF3799740.1 hypothetical protein GCG54_00000986 [Colletotrichum gloeosporioides]